MRSALALAAALAVPAAAALAQEEEQQVNPVSAPAAERRPHELTAHGHVRVDDYYWLRERDNPEVTAHLEAENDYTRSVMAHTEPLQERLFEEIKGRIKQTDSTAPSRRGEYFYYTRYEDGKEYPIHCRRRGSMEAEEEILLDVNALAEGHDYYDVSSWSVNPSQDVLAFAADTTGRRICTIHFKDLATGEVREESIPSATHNLAWAEDDRTLFYVRQHPETLRWYRLYRHELGTGAAADVLVYEEEDETFDAYVFKTRSRAWIVLGMWQTVSNEYRFIPAAEPRAEFRLLAPRQRDHEYTIDHGNGWFYLVTNDQARNFRLMRTPDEATGREHWEEVIPHREDVLLEDVDVFDRHLVAVERSDGLRRLRVRRLDSGAEHDIDFGEPAYLAYTYGNWEFDTSTLRYRYQSLTTPDSDYDYDMDTRQRVLVKREEVLGGDFDPAHYRTERLWATARDGARVPISMVYRKGLERDGRHPLLLYGYGSYGYTIDASFASNRLSLLDRGFVYAIAHVRGGQALGRAWYDDGKLLRKKNTFTDFIDCAEHLVAQGFTSPERLYAEGASAGGLLVGAVMNMRPDLFDGFVAQVPWVDVVTTMLDDSIPLTTGEYDEWGNPNERQYYDYMLSYSPYDNLAAGEYPNLLVLTSVEDAAVQYWEPAKWVARQRALRTGDSRLLLKTEMVAGHGGPSGRYRRYRETALIYAFLLDLAGVAEGG